MRYNVGGKQLLQVNKQSRTEKSDNHRSSFVHDKKKTSVSGNISKCTSFGGWLAEAFPSNAEAEAAAILAILPNKNRA